jgi:hypothetical protein
LNLKDKILDVLEAKDDQYTFDLDFDEYIKESLEKCQRHTMALRQIHMKQEEEIKRLTTDIISQAEEKNKVDNEINKRLEVNVNLKTQIEEARRKAKKSNRVMNRSTILDEILSFQRSPNDKSGIGYNKEATHFEASTSKKHEISPSFSKGGSKEAGPTPQSKFRRETPSRWTPKQRYENIFHGHCFSCNEYGHKALECRHYARKDVGRFNNILICWRCNQVGHIVAYCHTMRCYNCSGFGHKTQDCWNSRRQSMMSASCSMERRAHATWKKENVERMEAQSTSKEKPGHFQKWMKKTKPPEQNGSHEASSSLAFFQAYTGSYGNNRVYTRFV